MVLLKLDSETITRKVQISSFLYKLISDKYNKYYKRICKFDFLKPKVLLLFIDYNAIIELKKNNIRLNLYSLAIMLFL